MAVSLDGGTAQLVDLAATAAKYQQEVWTTGVLTTGVHTVKIWWYPGNAAGKYVNVDAFDIAGQPEFIGADKFEAKLVIYDVNAAFGQAVMISGVGKGGGAVAQHRLG